MAGRTGSIAVFVSDVTNPFYFDIIRGTQQQARAAGYSQLLVDTEESSELEQTMLRTLRHPGGPVLPRDVRSREGPRR